ncbi:neuropeptide F receptor-like [Bacillus rossius redtenbacheri]|uniref:neuropeptide F receptor-like n=1 Tax=Bacillus rossius redtenbacheri TaxID=93214 RepID=UPI002FDDE7EF
MSRDEDSTAELALVNPLGTTSRHGSPGRFLSVCRRQWTMGSALCKLVPVLQGTNIMVSVGTITVIALDRYFTIVRRSSQDASSNRRRVIVSIVLIWLLSLLATLPIFFFQRVESFTFQRVVIYETCIERWPTRAAQLGYTVCVLLLQSVIPALVVSAVHARIASYLHAHAKTQKDARRARKELERNRKTTLLLTGIAVMFAGSWLPLSLYSLLVDGQFLTVSTDSLYVALAVCHLVAMSSALSNPIVYGWLNSNIRHEFLQLLPGRCAASLQRQHSGRRARTTMGGATTALEDATTRTHLNASNAGAPPPQPPPPRAARNGAGAGDASCRESMTLLLLPQGGSKAVGPDTELSVL